MDTLGKMVRKQDYDSYTEMEVHAELVYAECLLLKVKLNLVWLAFVPNPRFQLCPQPFQMLMSGGGGGGLNHYSDPLSSAWPS